MVSSYQVLLEMALQTTWGTWEGTSTEILFWTLCPNWFYLINLTNLILGEPSSPVRIRNFMGKNALPLTCLSASLTCLLLPIQGCPAWELAEVALISEDIVIHYIVLFDMRNPAGCSIQSLSLFMLSNFLEAYLKKRRLLCDQARNTYTILLFTSVVSSQVMKIDSAVITTKYYNVENHSVNSLDQSCCWNLFMLLDSVLLGVISKSKRSCTFDLWGILSQYKPPSTEDNSTLLNSQSHQNSLAEVWVRATTWFLGCSSFHYLCNKQTATNGKKK